MFNPTTVSDIAKTLLGQEASEAEVSSYAQAFRNLIQRSHLPPVGRSGRADLFDAVGVCAIRLAEAIARTQLPRTDWRDYTQWLQQNTVGGTRIENAVARATSGEKFTHQIVFEGMRPRILEANPELDGAKAAMDDAEAIGAIPESTAVTLTIPAAAIIRDTLRRLGEL